MMKHDPSRLPNDILWGVAAIAEYIKREPRQVYYLIAKGAIPDQEARRKNDRSAQGRAGSSVSPNI